MYGGPPDPYRRPRPPMDPYGRGGYGGYGGGLFGSSGDCEGISLLPGLTVLALFIALVLFIIGFSAPYWIEGKAAGDNYLGLWRQCTTASAATPTVCKNLVGDNNPSLQWFTATQALTTIALIFLILALALLVYWLCTYNRFFFIKALIISLLFMTFIFMIVSVSVFGAKYDVNYANYDLEWCFYLVCAATIMVLLGLVFLICVPSFGSHPDFNFRDRFGFGYGAGRGMGGGGPPPPNPYGQYGGARDPYGSGLPYTSRY